MTFLQVVYGELLQQHLIQCFPSCSGARVGGQYQDTQYTSVSPFALAADTDTNLPNNAGSVIETQKPTDVTTFYDGTVITGRNGDGVTLTIEFQAEPTNVATTYLEVWVDIGGSVGELYRRIITFPKGQGGGPPDQLYGYWLHLKYLGNQRRDGEGKRERNG